MIVDTSAVLAILLAEPEGDRFIDAITAADAPLMSAATFVECSVVSDRRVGPANRMRFDRILDFLGVRVVPLTQTQAELAREAYRRFGRGSGHPARLNLGDCFSYALAADTGLPLLFKGGDFAATDLTPAPY